MNMADADENEQKRKIEIEMEYLRIKRRKLNQAMIRSKKGVQKLHQQQQQQLCYSME